MSGGETHQQSIAARVLNQNPGLVGRRRDRRSHEGRSGRGGWSWNRQVFGTPIHQVLLAPPGPPLAIAVAVIRSAFQAALVPAACRALRLPKRQSRAPARAVLASVAIARATDHETRAAPSALQLPTAEHQSSIRNLGTDDTAGAECPRGSGTRRAHGRPGAPAKESGRVFVYLRDRDPRRRVFGWATL